MREKFTCQTCGRPFPRGQGIVISRGGLTLTFHSSRCAYKFLRLVFERADERCVVNTARELREELEKLLEARRVKKRI